MKKAIFITLISFLGSYSFAQDLIAVQNGTKQEFYESIDSAFANAKDGDSLYFPGKEYIISDTISKKLHLFGTGHDYRSTTATNRTLFRRKSNSLPQLVYLPSSSGGSISGIMFVDIGGYNSIILLDSVENILIAKCMFQGNFVALGSSKSIIIRRSIFLEDLTVNLSTVSNCYIKHISSMDNSTLRNCIIEHTYNPKNNMIYENCIFSDWTNVNNFLLNGFSHVFKNNLNVGVNGISTNNSVGYNNHLDDIILDSVFVNYTGINSARDYTADFHLKPGSPYLNAGTNGTQLGIYGGEFPWEDGSVPNNPWIKKAVINSQTNTNGDLPVDIEVEAK